MEGHIGDGEGFEVDTLVDEEPVEVLKFLLVISTCGISYRGSREVLGEFYGASKMEKVSSTLWVIRRAE